MLPLSYQGFGFTAILLMALLLSMVETVKWLRGRMRRHAMKTGSPQVVTAGETKLPAPPSGK